MRLVPGLRLPLSRRFAGCTYVSFVLLCHRCSDYCRTVCLRRICETDVNLEILLLYFCFKYLLADEPPFGFCLNLYLVCELGSSHLGDIAVTSRPEKFPFYWELTKTPFRERETTTDEVVDFFKILRRGVVQVVEHVGASACICGMRKSEPERES